VEINMRRSVGLVLVFVFLAACMFVTMPVSASAEETENTWVSKAPMHQARAGLGVVAVNGKIYAIGGSNASGWAPSVPPSTVYGDRDLGGFVGTNEEYDPESDTWTYKASMSTPRMALATVAYQNKIYCIGGRSVAGDANGGYTAVNEVYDPATDTWETKAPMPSAMGWLIANVVGTKIYVMNHSGINYVYDPATNLWSTKTPVPAPAFNGYASAVIDKKIYVIGGLSETGDSNLNLIYDPETDTWSYGAPPPSSVGGGAATATTGALAPRRLYVIGVASALRQGAPQYSNRVYDPATDNWTAAADLPTVRYNFGIAAINETFYVIGGHTYNFLGDFAPSAVNEQYTPFGYGIVPFVVSPETNKTYVGRDVPLTFTLGKTASWMGYSLDGQDNVTITGNTTLSELPNGAHNITVYATDQFGNTGASDTVYFNVNVPEPFPIAPVAAGITSAAVVGIGALIYFKKRKH
jgi:N-acetylneuraminic acid mutarotase